MGSILSYFYETFWKSTQIEYADPDTKLTPSDVRIIKSTWRKLMQNTTQTGSLIFLTLFDKYPQYHQLFTFRDVPINELKDNKRFHAHCNNLMYGFAAIVDNLGEKDIVVELLVKQGQNHKERKVPEKAYWELKDVLLEIFKDKVKFNKEAIFAWDKCLQFMFESIIKGAQS